MSAKKDPARVGKIPEKEDTVPEDHLTEWSEEDRKIEDRKPDLGEIEEDTSEL